MYILRQCIRSTKATIILFGGALTKRSLDFIATAFVFLLFPALLFSQASATFKLSSTTGTGPDPYSATAGDFNGDGYLDIATVNLGDNTVSILLNNGSGTFTQSSTPGVGNNPISVIAGDFDGDGDIDLAVSNYSDNTVSILLNNGNGTFTLSSTVGVGNGPWSVTAGDFNGDGHLDLATANRYDNTVSILLNNGNGTFTLSSTIGVGSNPSFVTSRDFNGDGHLDLAVSNYNDNTVSILLNNGSGTFTLTSTTSVGSSPYSIAARDFDGDGDIDLAVANSGSGTISILLNNGSGTFTQSSTLGVGSIPWSVTAGDFNGDGHLDLAVAYQGSNTVSILLNNGSGTFTQSSTPGVGNAPNIAIAADLDGDGDIDLGVVNRSSSTVSILKNICAAPIGLVVTDSTSHTITLKWRKNIESTLLRYRIYQGTSPNPTTEVDSTTGGITDTSKTITGLINGTKSYFRVTAVDNTGNESGYSNEVSGTSIDLIPPATPQNLVVTDSSSHTITIKWRMNAEKDFMQYRIYQGASPNPNTIVDMKMGDITDTAKTFTGLVDGLRYYFRVTAIDLVGNESGYSNVVNAVPADRIAPAAPQNLVVTDSSSQTITIKWHENTEADFMLYRMYRGTSPNPTIKVDSIMGGIADTVKTITGLMNGTKYYFRMTAVDSVGNESGYSNEVDAVPADRIAPAAPQNLVATDSSGQSITIKWRKNIEADFMRYRVFRGTSPNPTIKVDSMISGITDTTKMFTGLTVGTRYYFRITAVDSAYNESGYSNEINAVPQTNIAFKDGSWYKAQNAASNKNNNPVGRFKLTADANGATLASVNVTFSGSFSGVTGVKLWSSADSIFGGDSRLDSVTFKSSPVALSGNASAINVGGTYYFVTVDLGASSGNITAKFASNADITLTAGTLTGTITDAPLAGNSAIITHVDNEEQLALRVFALSQNYPNPFNPTTTISFTLAENGYVSLKVFDVLGREAVTLVNAHLNAGVVHHAVLDASHLSSGMYFYRLEAGKNVMVKKFVLLK